MSAARERARAFVALPLGAELGDVAAARCAAVLDRDKFRLLAGEGLHLTLYFLGDVERGELTGIGAALGQELSGCPRPALCLRGTGAFPRAARANVLWIGVEERARPGRLAACRDAVLQGLTRAGIDTSAEASKPFRPHVTVARPRSRSRLPAEFGALALALDWDPVAVELVESHLGSKSRYECLARVSFAAESS